MPRKPSTQDVPVVDSISQEETVSPETITEEPTVTDTETAAEFTEESVDEETPDSAEETPAEEETPPPNLDELQEPLKTMAAAMKSIADKSREDYVKIHDVLTTIGDPEEYLSAKRNASENADVQARVANAKELQAQIAALFAEADAILRESGEVEIPTEEEQEKLREEQKTFRSAFDDSVEYGEKHIVPGFSKLFEALPGVRGRRKGSTQAAGESYDMTTRKKPSIAVAKLDGAVITNDKGASNFTVLAAALKKKSGQSVKIGDLHAAWMKASDKNSVEDITDDVTFPYVVNDKQYQITIERKLPEDSSAE